MDAMRESWTDERLDYLNHRVDDGFKDVDRRLDQIDKRLDRLDDSFSSWQRGIFQLGAGGIVTMLVGFLSVLATTL
jgi:hypothetical protein